MEPPTEISASSQMLIEGFPHLFLNRAPENRGQKTKVYINKNIALATIDTRLHPGVGVVHGITLPAISATDALG